MRQILTPVRGTKLLLDLSSPVVMGIINVTPDSFYSPSRKGSSGAQIVDFAGKMISEGATILDIGGMSSRPGASEIPTSEEADRVLPAIETLTNAFPDILLSVDTYRSTIAREAVRMGASIINDISAGELDREMFEVISSTKVAYIMMHMIGKPADMQSHAQYQDVIADVLKYFVNKLRQLHHNGIYDIIIDPGFGFSKTMDDNYKLIAQLNVFRLLGYPVMIGVSRKSSISKAIGKPTEETLNATTALHMAALLNGASILRVHDVAAAKDAIVMYNKLCEAKIH